MRRTLVVNRLLNKLYSRLCGAKWAKVEAEYLANSNSDLALQELQRAVNSIPSFAAVLRRDFEKMDEDSPVGVSWFSEVAARYHVCEKQGLPEFALQLASRPHYLTNVPSAVLDQLLLDIRDNSTLLRGARFLALLSVKSSPEPSGLELPGWKW